MQIDAVLEYMDTSRAVEKHFSGLLAIHGVAHEDAVDCEEFRLGNLGDLSSASNCAINASRFLPGEAKVLRIDIAGDNGLIGIEGRRLGGLSGNSIAHWDDGGKPTRCILNG